MKRRMEDRIRQLCSDVVAEKDEQKVHELSEELRILLRRHALGLRSNLGNYSFVERRTMLNISRKGSRNGHHK